MFWEGCEKGELRLERCGRCGKAHHFSPYRCPNCLSTELSGFAAGGRGRVASFTIVHRAPAPEFKGQTPYTIALVDLDEGPRVMARAAGAVDIGSRVRVTFPERPGRVLPTFVPEP